MSDSTTMRRPGKGTVFVLSEICKGCSFCVEFCPTNCLTLSKAFNPKGCHFPVLSLPEACSGCDLCGLYCPDFAIHGLRWKDLDQRTPLARSVPTAPAPLTSPSTTAHANVPADPKGVLTGLHFIDGDHAACEGAIAAGCRFAAGYPITPSTEIVERFAARIPMVGGVFIQLEDELASSIAVQGAAWGGKKTLSVTSGPGFSLMMEHIGLAAMTETPGVWVDVQRGGPSTGLPTLPAQSDMMQARWGSHGDYQIIALVPNSPQECFDLMIKAFNLSEMYRCPVLLMMDEVVGHMVERVEIPPADQIAVTPRKFTSKAKEDYRPFATTDSDLVPEMTKAGEGYRVHISGLTHDERGYPAMNSAAQDKLVRRLLSKIGDHADELVDVQGDDLDDAHSVVVSYGITSRIAKSAVDDARARGFKVGHLRLRVVWPFPAQRIRALCDHVKVFLMPELNMGQMVLELERAIGERAKVISIPHAGGSVHEPGTILSQILEATP